MIKCLIYKDQLLLHLNLCLLHRIDFWKKGRENNGWDNLINVLKRTTSKTLHNVWVVSYSRRNTNDQLKYSELTERTWRSSTSCPAVPQESLLISVCCLLMTWVLFAVASLGLVSPIVGGQCVIPMIDLLCSEQGNNTNHCNFSLSPTQVIIWCRLHPLSNATANSPCQLMAWSGFVWPTNRLASKSVTIRLMVLTCLVKFTFCPKASSWP